MDGFNEQLREVEGEMTGKAQDFPELSPEARKACQARLDATVDCLLKIQRNLKQEVREWNVDARTVRVLGLYAGMGVKASDFGVSFSKAAGNLRKHERDQAFIPDGLALTMEHNYIMDGTGKVLGAAEDWYITFAREEDACYALGLGNFMLYWAGTGREVKFAKPAQSSATRATFRKIGPLVERVKAIENELQVIGVSRESGMPKPDNQKYMDKSCFATSITGMKRAREAGQSLDHHAYYPLKHRKPVDMAKLQAQIKKLYDEECDCLITLREFQVNGVEFDF